MIQVSADIVGNRWDELPPEVREFSLSEELSDSVDSLCEDNALDDERNDIYLLTNLKVYGLLSDEDLKESLIKVAGPEKGQAVFNSLNGLISENLKTVIAGLPKVAASSLFNISSPPIKETPPEPEVSAPGMNPAVEPAPVQEVIPSPQPVTEPPVPAPVSLPSETPSSPVNTPTPVSPINPPVAAPAPVSAPISPSFGSSTDKNSPAVPAAPFMIHQEKEVLSVVDSAPSSSRLTPLRPSFYTPEVEGNNKPAFARLQFGSSPEKPFSASRQNEPISVGNPAPANPAMSAPEKPVTPDLSGSARNPVSAENIVNLRDLPL